jgi:hypothetical protein
VCVCVCVCVCIHVYIYMYIYIYRSYDQGEEASENLARVSGVTSLV